MKIENTSIKGRFNLVDETIPNHDDDHYIRQMSRDELISLVKSIIDLIQKE